MLVREHQINIILDGKQIIFDIQTEIINGRTLVPLRKTFEAFGMTVEWNSESKKIIATTVGTLSKIKDKTIVLTIDVTGIYYYNVDKDIAILKVNNSTDTFVPVILGNSDNAVMGKTAFAIGSPLATQTPEPTAIPASKAVYEVEPNYSMTLSDNVNSKDSYVGTITNNYKDLDFFKISVGSLGTNLIIIGGFLDVSFYAHLTEDYKRENAEILNNILNMPNVTHV